MLQHQRQDDAFVFSFETDFLALWRQVISAIVIPMGDPLSAVTSITPMMVSCPAGLTV